MVEFTVLNLYHEIMLRLLLYVKVIFIIIIMIIAYYH
jgi:hypothetical protein